MKTLSPIKEIRAKCLDCTCDSYEEIRQCPVTDCSLYPYRLGKNPYIKREYTDEQRAAARERLMASRSTAKTILTNKGKTLNA